MTKIYTKLVIDIATSKILEEDFFEYDGEMALCFETSKQSSKPLSLDANMTTIYQWMMDYWTGVSEGYDPNELLDKFMGDLGGIQDAISKLPEDVRGIVNSVMPMMGTAQEWLTNSLSTLTDLYNSVEEPIQYNRNILSKAGDYWLNAEKEYEGIKAGMPTVGFVGNTGSGSSNVNMQSFPANAANRFDQQFNTAAGIGQNAVNSMGSLMGLKNTIAGTGLGAIEQYGTNAMNMANLGMLPINTALQTAPLQTQLAEMQYQAPLDWMDFIKRIQLSRYGQNVQSSSSFGITPPSIVSIPG